MARYWFGGGVADWSLDTVTVSGTANLAQVAGGATITFWTAEAGGSQYTDILDSDGVAVTVIESADGTVARAAGQIPPLQGPDEVQEMWASANDGPRALLVGRHPSGSETTAGAQAKADAAQAAAIATSAQRAANLSDVANTATARTNLGAAQAAPHPLTAVLRRGQQNAVLAVLGDSTGVPANFTTDPRWVFLLTQYLAAQFPAYTVNYRQWSDTNQTYDALGSGTSRVVQTGTGAFTLDVYNGSVSGASVEYVLANGNQTRISAMIPATPDAVILSYAKNSTETVQWTYRKHVWPTARFVKDMFPTTGLTAVVQCPNGPAAGNQAAVFNRLADVRSLAAQEGWYIADVCQAFIDYGPGYATDLLNPDGVHPSSAGSALWAETVQQVFAPRASLLTVPATPVAGRSIMVPAKAFDLLSGAPTYGVSNGLPAWSMPAGADSAVVATMINLPGDWRGCNVYLLWFSAATAGQVSFSPRFGWLSTMLGNQSGTPIAPTALGTLLQSATSATVNQVRFLTSPIHTDTTFAGRPLTVTVTRNGAGDSLAGTAQFVGVLFERAS